MSIKTEQVVIRCTSTQRERWERAAELDRRTLTDWVRIQLDDAADRAIQAAEKRDG
ncbi:type II toxin -antitoxin system TacA 1-like antitoxin [Rubinisphaera brasiliensis]|uniref:Uncharacterized protein n=1 Tax=Rubinisphaera brasiliensis (strain ATCC 49424 / DSM 5305 / JCM 21570 / IAM 15109 / NBRC 103401 / IFAM 1448) TaxID=756272 RepID=F0SL31_RUBBR|nr:DUF1778 domain-containing protein [Rubinisphaera brasiliensis]ADY60914.1 hypothetical protein Plabr_3317 [Rubinisphaera brasiliensis DSM 5305]